MLSLSHLLFFGPIAFSLVRIFFCDSFELACFLSSLLFFCTPLPPLCFHHCTLQSLELSELLSQFFFWFFLFLGEINILLNLFLSLRESVSFVFIYLFLCPDTFSRSRSLKLALPVYSVSPRNFPRWARLRFLFFFFLLGCRRIFWFLFKTFPFSFSK